MMHNNYDLSRHEQQTSIHTPRRVVRYWLVVALAMILVAPLYAQYETASVLGYVRDGSGSAITSAKVTLTNTATGIALTTTTNSEGKYEFTGVRIGQYTVLAAKDGFETATTAGFTVSINARQ